LLTSSWLKRKLGGYQRVSSLLVLSTTISSTLDRCTIIIDKYVKEIKRASSRRGYEFVVDDTARVRKMPTGAQTRLVRVLYGVCTARLVKVSLSAIHAVPMTLLEAKVTAK
jgi:hypothetical protein